MIKDPIQNFLDLYQVALQRGVPDPHAMALATVNSENKPSVRIVYYKGMIRRGFSFYTNYQGRKGRDLEKNPFVSGNFFWPVLEQQVRIEGYVEKLSREESESYFQTRPRVSQLGAWASLQSQPLESTEFFQKRLDEVTQKYSGVTSIPCPPYWGGYIIVPELIEFWFGRQGRLHERHVFEKTEKLLHHNAIKGNEDWNFGLRYP